VRVNKHGKHKNNLYYLMPGMGRGARKRFWRNLFLGVLVGLLVSAGMWWLFSYQNTQ
jgi:Tfp pilus assembly protein PilN